MNYTKQQLIADIKITDGVVHWNSYYYNLFDCKTQKEKDVVRNAVNRLRHHMRVSGWEVDKNGNTIYSQYSPVIGSELYTSILDEEKKYAEESRALAIKIFFAVVAIAGVIYSYLHM